MQPLEIHNYAYFTLDCKITNPYIVIAEDYDLALSTLLKRLKIKQERTKI